MTGGQRIYFDHHATTPVDPRVLEAMLPWFGERFGNAASRNHAFGWEADRAVAEAREGLAAGFRADPRGLIFTSGATEANNLALFGVARAFGPRKGHLVTGATEHPSVLDPLRALARQGWDVTELGVDSQGRLDLAELRAALRPETVLVSLMHANNEVGTLHPIGEIGAICRERGILFHTDAAQSAGKEFLDVEKQAVDLLTVSSHKIYGPKGAGFLWVRRRSPRVILEPLLLGGGHEQGLRSGTLNVPGIVGMAAALRIAPSSCEEENARIARLRDRLQEKITSALERVRVHGDPGRRLAGNLNLSFEFVQAEALLRELEGVALSTGSACTTAELKPSHVLRAMGVPDRLAAGSLRFGLGRFNTIEEVDAVAEQVVRTVGRLRERSPLWRMAREDGPASTPLRSPDESSPTALTGTTPEQA
ncbi:MAG: cysteine desulfurase family protein [Planctomycetota bacterium]